MSARIMPAAAAFVLASRLAAAPVAEPPPPLYHNLPKDPLVVIALSVDEPMQAWRGLLDLSGKLGDADLRRRVASTLDELSARSGVALDTELVAQLGPQLALAIDVPPIDIAAIALQAGQPGAATAALGRIGLLAEVRDAARFDRALRALVALGGGETATEPDGMAVSRFPVSIKESGAPQAGVRAELALHHLVRDGRIAIGFSREWVLQALETSAPKDRLAAGEDFARVFGQLDREAVRITYVNLPKVRQLVADSQIVTAVLEANPKTAELVRLLSAKDVMEVGLGSTSVPVAGGVRTTNFGPAWLAGPVLSSGVVAALAVPALILTDADSDGRDTLEDIQEIARACEGFSSDTQRYPRSQGWVPVERIALYLEPVYATSLARLDEWDNPILYWSDGSNYRILSTGEDGRMDRDWSSQLDPAQPAAANGDIVFGDGGFLVLPASLGKRAGR